MPPKNIKVNKVEFKITPKHTVELVMNDGYLKL